MLKRVTSLAALIVVMATTAAAQPSNDDCTAATVIGGLPYVDQVDVSGATTAASDPAFECPFTSGEPTGDGPGNRSVWYVFTAPAAMSIEVDTTGSDYDTVLNAWLGACDGPLTWVGCNDDDLDASSFDEQSRMLVSLSAGESVLIEATNPDGPPDGNRLVLHVREEPVFRVGAFLTFRDNSPSVAAASDGTFLAVWNEDDPTDRILARRYDADGLPIGSAVQINTDLVDFTRTSVAWGGDRYLAVWGFAGAGRDLHGRLLDVTGTPQGSEIVIADSSEYRELDVAGDGSGVFTVVWNDFPDIAGRRIDSTGTPVGGEFVVNPGTGYFRDYPSVASDASGNVVVVWESYPSAPGPAGDEIRGRRFDATGAPLGADFAVNESTTGGQEDPAVVVQPGGSFVVAWTYQSDRTVARRFDGTGTPVTSDFVVDVGLYDVDNYNGPEVSSDGSGNFLVVWTRHARGPVAQRYDAAATPIGAPFFVADVEASYMYPSDVAASPGGDFVVAWEQYIYSSRKQVFGRHLAASDVVCAYKPRDDCRGGSALVSKLVMKDQEDDGRDLVSWKWTRGAATALADFGDPSVDTGFALCVYEDQTGFSRVEHVVDSAIEPGGTCAGLPCWKDAGAKGFRYKDKDATPDGVKRLVLKPGAGGKAKIAAKGVGVGLAQPALPLAPPVRVQLQASNGECWESVFEAGDVQKSTPQTFVAKAGPS